MRRGVASIALAAVVATGCASSADSTGADDAAGVDITAPTGSGELATGVVLSDDVRGEVIDFGPAPAWPTGALSAETAAAIEQLFGERIDGIFLSDDMAAIDALGASGDPRVAWLLADLLRVMQEPGVAGRITTAASELLGIELDPFRGWNDLTSHLIAWDIPAPPDYLDAKAAVFTAIVPEWDTLFDRDATDMDWRHVSWGGVRIDDRPFDQTDEPCNCIPAADNPPVETASESTWLDADDVVFGVVINGESRAYPRQIMEVREMVNDTLGGRDFAMPYCTLCGAAQVWFTDDVPAGVERPILRTSGLLTRSNKVMYDLNTFSIFDTFLGEATTGPLAAQGVALDGHTVVTSTWEAWVAEHPDTTVLVESLALGRDFDFRNGRDADGPIFPIGDVDPRLGVHEDVLGVITPAGDPLAIHVASALEVLDAGQRIEIDGVEVRRSGDGLVAVDSAGDDLVAHQAFWFAWSQFHPDTALWPL